MVGKQQVLGLGARQKFGALVMGTTMLVGKRKGGSVRPRYLSDGVNGEKVLQCEGVLTDWRFGSTLDGNKAGELWAIALSEDGQYLASTTYDGRINVWDLVDGRKKIREFETKGSFGMCIDLSRDGRFTASGHENGGVYVFNNETGRMLHSLPGMGYM